MDLRAEWDRRPWWMNLMFGFCVYMTFIYMPWDIFIKPVAEDQEVWFGILFTGWAAKATAPFHWLVYGAGAYGFWKMSAFMWPWAAVYLAQVAFSMFVFGLVDARGHWAFALVAGSLFMIPTVAMWRAKARFRPEALPVPT